MKLPDYTVINGKGAVKMFQTVFKRYEKKYIIDGRQRRNTLHKHRKVKQGLCVY